MEKKWDNIIYLKGDFDSYYNLIKDSKLRWKIANKGQFNGAPFNELDVHYLVDEKGNKDPRMIMLSYMGHFFDIGISFGGDEYDFELIDQIEEQIQIRETEDNNNIRKWLTNLKKLRDIYFKTKNGETLTREELEYLYETRKRIKLCTNDERPLMNMIKDERSIEQDILDLGITSVTLTKYNNFDFGKIKDSRCFKNIKHMTGMIDFNSLTDVEGFSNLESLEGYFSFPNVTSSKGLENLSSIKGYVDFSSLKDTTGLKKLKSINGVLDLSGLGNSFDVTFIQKYSNYDAFKLNSSLIKNNIDKKAYGYDFYKEAFYNRFLEYNELAGINPARNPIIEGRLITPSNKSLVYKKGE